MSVEFCGRASDGEVEHLQEPFKAWLRSVLEESEPEAIFIVVLRGFVRYAEPMPPMRVFESTLVPLDILIEVFPAGGANGLSYALYLPPGVNRAGLVLKLESRAASFG